MANIVNYLPRWHSSQSLRLTCCSEIPFERAPSIWTEWTES